MMGGWGDGGMGCPSSSPLLPLVSVVFPRSLTLGSCGRAWCGCPMRGVLMAMTTQPTAYRLHTYQGPCHSLLLPGPQDARLGEKRRAPFTTVVLGSAGLRHDLRFGLRDGFCRELPTACRASYCIVDAAWVAHSGRGWPASAPRAFNHSFYPRQWPGGSHARRVSAANGLP